MKNKFEINNGIVEKVVPESRVAITHVDVDSWKSRVDVLDMKIKAYEDQCVSDTAEFRKERDGLLEDIAGATAQGVLNVLPVNEAVLTDEPAG